MQNTRSILEMVPGIAAARTRKETNLHVGDTLAFDGMLVIKRTPSSLIMKIHNRKELGTTPLSHYKTIMAFYYSACGR